MAAKQRNMPSLLFLLEHGAQVSEAGMRELLSGLYDQERRELLTRFPASFANVGRMLLESVQCVGELVHAVHVLMPYASRRAALLRAWKELWAQPHPGEPSAGALAALEAVVVFSGRSWGFFVRAGHLQTSSVSSRRAVCRAVLVRGLWLSSCGVGVDEGARGAGRGSRERPVLPMRAWGVVLEYWLGVPREWCAVRYWGEVRDL